MTDDTNQNRPTSPPATDAPLAPGANGGSCSALPEAEVPGVTDDIIAAPKAVYDPDIPAAV